jgi:hypothetical protein
VVAAVAAAVAALPFNKAAAAAGQEVF